MKAPEQGGGSFDKGKICKGAKIVAVWFCKGFCPQELQDAAVAAVDSSRGSVGPQSRQDVAISDPWPPYQVASGAYSCTGTTSGASPPPVHRQTRAPPPPPAALPQARDQPPGPLAEPRPAHIAKAPPQPPLPAGPPPTAVAAACLTADDVLAWGQVHCHVSDHNVALKFTRDMGERNGHWSHEYNFSVALQQTAVAADRPERIPFIVKKATGGEAYAFSKGMFFDWSPELMLANLDKDDLRKVVHGPKGKSGGIVKCCCDG